MPQVAYYGLSAAGTICLWFLNNLSDPIESAIWHSNVLQNLYVLIAHAESGALVHTADPNYALLARATRTMKSVMDTVVSWNPSNLTQPHGNRGQDPVHQTSAEYEEINWEPWAAEQDLPDFELDFWLNLAEHPALIAPYGDSLEEW